MDFLEPRSTAELRKFRDNLRDGMYMTFIYNIT